MSRRFVWFGGAIFLFAGAIILSRSDFQSARNAGRGSNVEQDAHSAVAGSTGGRLSPVAGGVAKAVPSSQNATNSALPREFDPAINPYAGALRRPGEAKRAWDANFLAQLGEIATNSPIQFELTGGAMASGVVKITQSRDGRICYISGELDQPETGRFFFLTPPPGGKAGKAVGVVEFWGSKSAYRAEPTGPNGDPELWKRRLDEVLCQTMPLMEQEATAPDIAEIPPLRPDMVADYVPAYNSNIVSLQSYPGSSAVLLLDFFGGYTPTWGGVTYPRPNVSNAQIKDLWKRVAEDYLPFNINVTTDLKIYQNAPANSRQKCVFSPNISAMPSGAAGVAYVGSWNWGSDTVCWSVYTSGKAGGEVGSHESGHTVGLGHQGTSSTGYFSGHGSGATGWAPIMGAGYYDNVVSWAKGEYSDANNHEDELNIITTQNNNVAYRPDDTGNTLATSRYLEVYPGNTASAEGVIERTGDTDAFQFTTAGGVVTLTAAPVGDWANLALSATLANASEAIIASNNPQTSLSAGITTTLAAGTYTFRVTGVGRNDPLTDGFTSYGSLGYYSITGTVAAARLPTRLSVAEHAPNGTLVGTVFPITTDTSLAYSIASGNTGNTFSIDSRGTLRVAINTLLDYSRLATNSMLPVQFQLLVNIVDLTDSTKTELNRRVVVSVLDVNDAPSITGFAASVMEHTRPGTAIGSVSVRDPDFGQRLTYAIVSGDPLHSFSIDNAGLISVAGDLAQATASSYSLAVAVCDNAIGSAITSTGYVSVTVVANRTPFQTGSISYALYDDIGSGTTISDLTSNARWPRDPSSELQMPTFEGISNRADNYGTTMRGYLVPPVSGSYVFWISSDDSSELWFSTSTNNNTLSRIAYVSGYTGSRQWNRFTSQQSSAITLAAGQGYYVEARMKEGGGADSLAIAWRGPATANQTNVISGLFLAPCPMNYVPHATGFSATLRQGAFTGTAVGHIEVSDVNAADTHRFVITSGNDAGLFEVDADSGIVRVVDEAALLAAPAGAYTLAFTVTDSGVPPLAATTSATITLTPADAALPPILRREIWSNIGSGTAVSDLTNNPAFPGRPDKFEDLTSFASAVNVADNYGSRIRAYLTPAISGTYRFFVASDDASSLLMSVNDNPTNAARIAYVSGWTSANAWNSTASQISALRTLVAGQRYYMEVLQKEGGGGDHVEVAWTGPGIVDGTGAAATNIIDSSYLSPVDLNYPPQFLNQTLPIFSTVSNGVAVGRVVAQDSPLDSLSYQIVGGNTNNMFAIDAATGIISVIDNTLVANGSVTSFPLTVAVQDSGCGGLYAPLTAKATVIITVQDPAAGLFVWTGADAANTWTSPGNWGGASPTDGARLIFGYPWQQSNVNNALGSVASVQFTNGGFNISGKSVSMSSGIVNRGDNSWALETTLTGSQSWINSSGTFSVTGPITNAGLPLTLTATADIRVSGPISGAGGLYKGGAARLIMEGDHSYSGSTVVSAASGTTTALEVGADDLGIPNSDLTMNGRMDLGGHDATVGALNGSGTIFAGDLTHTITVGANGHSGAFSGVLQNSASASGITLNVVKAGAGKQVLSGANTYSGLTAVTGGTLLVANASALGSTAGGTVVANGATLALSNNITIPAEALTLSGAGAEASGALRNDYGLNTFNGALTLSGPVTIRAALGRLTLGGPWNTAGYASALSFDAGPVASIVVSGGIEGGGSLVKAGGGTVWLYGTNNYTGSTTINEGTLTFGANSSARRSSGFVVAGGATMDVSAVTGGWALLPGQSLQGRGSIIGSATVLGMLLPGGSIGTLKVSGNLALDGMTSMEIAKTGSLLTNDQIQCTGTLTPGGVMSITHTGPDSLAVGDSFILITAAAFAAGSFDAVNLPGLPAGLMWDTSTLALDGAIRVQPATPPNLQFQFGAGNLTLSWPADYSGYILEAQTNGLDSGWVAVPGVSNNNLTIPIDPANTSVLFRLLKP